MITLQNMIFANPQAYQVFPNMVNTYNTGTIEKAVYTGHIVITDSSGNTYNFTNTSTIDFNNISGIVTINNVTDTGSVQLGRWNITSSTPEPEPGSDSKKASEAVAGDAVLYDETNDKLVIVDNTKLEDYTEGYIPIGVVVVPGTHDVYEDGSCGVMSLKEMNYSSPDSGSTSYQFMYWGVRYGDDTSLPNLNRVPTGNTSNGIPTGSTDNGFLPSDNFSSSGTQCAYDTDAYYYTYSSSSRYIPSPYLTDGSRNPGYYQTTSPSSSSNALADFDGIGNSQVLWELATAQSDWKTASSITNDRGSGYYPAACCCWRYHTEGTSQGDWYLPGCGELGYILPPFNKINDAIDKMRTAYGSSVGVELTGNDYWSSTEVGIASTRNVTTGNGYVGSNSKGYYGYVRAFLRIKDNNNNIDIVR